MFKQIVCAHGDNLIPCTQDKLPGLLYTTEKSLRQY